VTTHHLEVTLRLDVDIAHPDVAEVEDTLTRVVMSTIANAGELIRVAGVDIAFRPGGWD
jgi:hypothetical protein